MKQAVPAKGNRKRLCFACLFIFCAFLRSEAALAGNEYLDMDISQLMQITITSVAKKPQSLSDSPAAVFVITSDDIHRLGITSIPEALRLAPGLQVARVDANKWAITSRGFSGTFANKLLVMIDGRTVYSPAFSGVYWDVQDTLLEDIDRIEVIRGPGATIWGANAVNGVINIITKKTDDTAGGFAAIGVGSEERLLGEARYGIRFSDSISGRAYVKYRDQDSLVLHYHDRDAGDAWNSVRSGFRVDGKNAFNHSGWTLQGDIYSNREDQIVFPAWQDEYPYMVPRNDTVESSGGNVIGRWQRKFSAHDSLSMQMYYDLTSRDELAIGQKHQIVDMDVHYQTRLGRRHGLSMGLGYRYTDSEFENTFQVAIDPDNRSENLYSCFLQDEILLTDQLWLTVGAKWEHNDFTGGEIQPSGRILWRINKANSLWAAVSRAVRIPSEFEEDGHLLMGLLPSSDGKVVMYALNGDDDLKAEELLAYEAGYRWMPAAVFSLDLSLFYNDYTNLLAAEPLSPLTANTLYLHNIMHGSTYGVELAADWQVSDPLSLRMAYSYIGFDLDIDADSLNSIGDDIVAEVSPRHQVSLVASYTFSPRLQVSFWGRYVGRLDASKKILSHGQLSTDAYCTLDATLTWKVTEQLELMLNGRNLFDESHLEYISEYSTPPTEVERSVYFQMSYRF